MSKYKSLSKEICDEIIKNTSDKCILEDTAVRRNPKHDKATLWRPAFVRDAEKILHCPYYNRYSDKTQVFSLYKNDDISRRALHVQLVSRIARNIGRMLSLNCDLIEAIALGHDIGHTPFGHAGEKYLDILYNANTGRHFLHNLHSVRVLDRIFNYNISLQTLDGILCHNGESERKEYHCADTDSFEKFDAMTEKCYTDLKYAAAIMPSTKEGCVVRISDLIAYIGKDRQDAIQTGVIDGYGVFSNGSMGNFNAAIINNMIINVIENSIGKDYIALDEECFENLRICKRENYELIYLSEKVSKLQQEYIAPIFEELYGAMLSDVNSGNKSSPVYRHHIDFINDRRKFYGAEDYAETESNQIVVDYLASMTDDYMVELYDYLFPGKSKIKYFSYFEDISYKNSKNV